MQADPQLEQQKLFLKEQALHDKKNKAGLATHLIRGACFVACAFFIYNFVVNSAIYLSYIHNITEIKEDQSEAFANILQKKEYDNIYEYHKNLGTLSKNIVDFKISTNNPGLDYFFKVIDNPVKKANIETFFDNDTYKEEFKIIQDLNNSVISFSEWQSNQASTINALKNINQPEIIETVFESKPNLINDFQDQQRNITIITYYLYGDSSFYEIFKTFKENRKNSEFISLFQNQEFEKAWEKFFEPKLGKSDDEKLLALKTYTNDFFKTTSEKELSKIYQSILEKINVI